MSDTSKVDLQTGLSEKNLQEMVKKFEKYEEIFTVKLFGSRATAQYKLASDVDLCIFGEDVTSRTVARLKDDLEEETTIPYFFDVVNYQSVTTDALKHNIDKEGKIIYRRGWKEVTLGEVVEVVGGGTPKTSVPEYWGGSIPWLSIADFNCDSRHVFKTEKHITEEGLNNSSTKKLNSGDIIISARGTVGALAQLSVPMAFNQSCYGLKSKDLSDINFLYYGIKNIIGEIRNNTHGSVFDTITKDTFNNLFLHLPPLPEQKAIARTLSCLDDKIELNNKMNKTLEEMAQALYKRWFVEFEFPNADGLPYKSSGGEMVQSELGLIPKGWEVGKMSSFGKIVCGKTPSKAKKHFFDGEIPFIKIPDMHGNIYIKNTTDTLTKEGAENQKNKYLPPYSICVSCIATVGLVAMNCLKSQTNQQINSIVPYKNIDRYYLFFSLVNYKEELISLGRGGTTTLNVNTTLFSNIKFVNPNENILTQFYNKINSSFKKIESNTTQTQTLTNIRNALLPKLMAGEIRVPFDKDML